MAKRIMILATDGFEQSELEKPKQDLEDAGFETVVVAPHEGEIRGWQHTDWGTPVKVDITLEKASEAGFDALVLPGGVINPDKLRANETAVGIVKAFVASGKPVAAICHGPWLLIEAGAVKGREVTSYTSVRTDLLNAGARWVDKKVTVDEGIITSRNPGDIDAFVAKIIEEVGEGPHRRAA
jgi:protease I